MNPSAESAPSPSHATSIKTAARRRRRREVLHTAAFAVGTPALVFALAFVLVTALRWLFGVA